MRRPHEAHRRAISPQHPNADRRASARAPTTTVMMMSTIDTHSIVQERKFPLGYALIATFVAVVTLALFARELGSTPAPQRQVVVQTTPEPLVFEITPSPVMGFGPAQMATGDGGQ